MNSVELFAGAGGLALGVSQAGFRNKAVVEWDADACATIRHNQRRKVPLVRNWKLHQADVKSFDFGTIDPDIDLLAAGVPCQPWSMGGKPLMGQAEIAPLAEKVEEPPHAHTKAFYSLIAGSGTNPADITVGATAALTAIPGHEAMTKPLVVTWAELGVEL